MILIGQYDSPFVRRVAIALTLYGLAYEHRRWSVFGDADALGAVNPLRRVPTLVCDDGVALTDSAAILDWIDGLVGPERALFPAAGPARRDAMRRAALACGLADKAVSLFYEHRLHTVVSPLWVERCTAQIGETAALLEGERAACAGDWFGGDRPGHDDIALACVWRFVTQAHPGLLAATAYPALMAHSARAEALPVFAGISQPFIPPA